MFAGRPYVHLGCSPGGGENGRKNSFGGTSPFHIQLRKGETVEEARKLADWVRGAAITSRQYDVTYAKKLARATSARARATRTDAVGLAVANASTLAPLCCRLPSACPDSVLPICQHSAHPGSRGGRYALRSVRAPAACRLCLTRRRAGVGTEALAQEDTSAGDVVSSHLAGEAETAAVVALADLSPSMGAPPPRACPQRARLQLNSLVARSGIMTVLEHTAVLGAIAIFIVTQLEMEEQLGVDIH